MSSAPLTLSFFKPIVFSPITIDGYIYEETTRNIPICKIHNCLKEYKGLKFSGLRLKYYDRWVCRACKRDEAAQDRLNNPIECATKKLSYYHKTTKYKLVKRIKETKEKPCMDCGIQYPYYVMQFDHRDPKIKIKNVSLMWNYSDKKFFEEVAKCDIICANCHFEREHQRRHK